MVDGDSRLEEEEVVPDCDSNEQSSPYGEIAPDKHDVAKILGEELANIGNARYWNIRETFDTAKDARVYREIEKAIRHLNVSDSDKSGLIERVKKKSQLIQSESGLAMKQADYSAHVQRNTRIRRSSRRTPKVASKLWNQS